MGDTEASLVGRRAEIDQLRTAVEEVGRGSGRIFTVEGPAGIGKTRLVAEVLDAARTRGFQTMHGGGAELEHRRPFGAAADCLGVRPGSDDERRSSIAGLLLGAVPSTHGIPAEAATNEFRAVEAMLALVEELCAEGPVAMAIDDLQWADPSTLLFLHRLARYLGGLPALLICCWRPVPRTRELSQLADAMIAAGGTRLVLGPLAEQDVIEFLRTSTGAEPGPKLRRLASGSGGNPLFLRELMAALGREGGLRFETQGHVEATTLSLPLSLSLAILDRLSYLSEEALEVLRVAAVLGSRIDLADVCLLLGRSATSLLGAFREVVGAGILDEDGDRLVFSHDLLREALYYDLPGPVRAGMHRDAARLLADAGASAERVAEHAARGATPGDRFAMEWLRRAAAEVATRAPAVAVDWLDQALRLAGPDDPLRGEIGADRAMSLLWSGRVLEAETACRELLSVVRDRALGSRVRLCLAQALFGRGRGEEAVEVAEEAARGPALSSRERALVRAWVSLGLMATGRVQGAVDAARAALAEPDADQVAISVSLTTLATGTSFRGLFREAVEEQARAIAVADESVGQAAHRFPLNFFQGLFLVEIDDLDGARLALARGRRISEELGARGNLPLYAWASAWVRFVGGAWDDALAECEASLALADELGARHGIVLVYALRSLVTLHRGELEQAELAAAAAEHELAVTGPQHGLENVLVWARALLVEASGDSPGAVATLSRSWDALREAGVAGYRFDLGPDLVRLAVATGDLGRAESVTEEIEQLAAMNPGLTRAAGVALHCRGMVTSSLGVLEQAAGALGGCARPFEAARALEDAAAALAQAGERAASRQRFEEALVRFEELEARRAVARAEARMRELGVRRGSRAPRRRPVTGWASLTATERSVADLAASGLTNPQIAERLFVSRHTVHTHVSHVLAKLQLASRVELAAEVAALRAQRLGEDAKQVEPADEGHRRAAVDAHQA